MSAGAQLSVTDLRRSTRHPVNFQVIGEHRAKGDVQLHISNISPHGFMVDGAPAVTRGDRLVIRLPGLGRIEAYCIWLTGERAGFQFERIIRLDDYLGLIEQMQPNPRLRNTR